MARVPEEVIEQIKQANDIVDIVQEKVNLKRSGSNYMGLCPFHNDNNPSFSVSRSKQIYKCFACGEGGNVISFVMKTQSMAFDEALRYLGKRAGIEVPTTGFVDQGEMKKREDLENTNRLAARFFFEKLRHSQKAVEYLNRRGIHGKTRTAFGLGYSPDSWNDLLNHLKRQGVPQSILEESGLFSGMDRGKFYDRFRNRLMFPVFDHRGRVIGFGGRVLDDSKPKYLNSPETILFHKGVNLYGLNLFIKNRRPQDDELLVVEGYMDVIALHQAGIHQAVAALGTALTSNQARLMKRYVSKVITSFDADEAGQTATIRSLDILSQEGLEVKVLQIPDGKDPDDYIKVHGGEAFLKLMDQAISLTEFRIKRAKIGLNLNKEDDKVKYFERLKPLMDPMNEVQRAVWTEKVSEETGVDKKAILSMLSTGYDQKVWQSARLGNERVESGHQKAQRYLLKLMAQGYPLKDRLSREEFAGAIHRRIFELLEESQGKNVDAYLTANLEQADYQAEWAEIYAQSDLPKDVELDRLAQDYINTIHYYNNKRRKQELLKQIAQLEKEGRLEESLALTRELLSLSKKQEEN